MRAAISPVAWRPIWLATGHLLFLPAILPQCADIGRSAIGDVVLATFGSLSITAVPMVEVSRLAAGAGRLLPRCHRWVSRVGGLASLGFAANLANRLE